MKKIISLTLFLLLLLSLLVLPAAASETDASAVTEGGGFTETLAAFITTNADTLLGILTLVGSLLVAFFYKTGLMPVLRSGLSALGELLGKSRDLTEHFTKETGDRLAHMEESVAPMLDAMRHGEELLLTLEAKLSTLEDALNKSEEERRTTAAVLRTETELFYELLSSVNLPEAQKDSMTESYYRLKRVLEAGE
ncbi:MAG: hypothetical protein E7609_03755 [Ruminococcaceae bacterium]|nr:hypothetical protein [Oscillospiraceae bacterium]